LAVHGRKATSLPWEILPLRPVVRAGGGLHGTLASDYAFQWRETEASFIRVGEVPSHRLDIGTKSMITQHHRPVSKIAN